MERGKGKPSVSPFDLPPANQENPIIFGRARPSDRIRGPAKAQLLWGKEKEPERCPVSPSGRKRMKRRFLRRGGGGGRGGACSPSISPVSHPPANHENPNIFAAACTWRKYLDPAALGGVPSDIGHWGWGSYRGSLLPLGPPRLSSPGKPRNCLPGESEEQGSERSFRRRRKRSQRTLRRAQPGGHVISRPLRTWKCRWNTLCPACWPMLETTR